MRKAVLIAMAVAVLLTTGPVHGIVICIGDDGHVAVETAHKGIGLDIETMDVRFGETPASESQIQHVHRGNCLDIPFGGNGSETALNANGQMVKVFAKLVLAAVPVPHIPSTVSIPTENAGAIPRVGAHAPAILRTTVLLI
jgi:hypothetical protein